MGRSFPAGRFTATAGAGAALPQAGASAAAAEEPPNASRLGAAGAGGTDQ